MNSTQERINNEPTNHMTAKNAWKDYQDWINT